jgi:hypothetical protein
VSKLDKRVILFTQEKETKGTYRYAEVEDGNNPPAIGTLYVKKYVLGTPAPSKLQVTLEEVK